MEPAEFESARPRLVALATRMLGSRDDALDAVQETWLRASRADTGDVANFDGWLTTVTSRLCLDMLRARRIVDDVDDVEVAAAGPGPDELAALADSVGAALSAVLDELGTAERVAFVLHDVFAVSFDEVASVLGKSPAATRQLASRARRRLAGRDDPASSAATAGAPAVSAFIAASRDGDFDALVRLLDPDAVYRTHTDDGTSALAGGTAIAEAFRGRAVTAYVALLDGLVGIAVPTANGVLLATELTFGADGRIVGIETTMRRAELDAMEIRPFGTVDAPR